MSRRFALVLLSIAMLAVSCAPPPLAPATVAPPTTAAPTTPPTVPATAAPTSAPTAAATAPTPIPASTPTPAATAPTAWQTYTNPDVPFTISYPPGWTQSQVPADASSHMKSVQLDGPEGLIVLQWGSGFGGACLRYSVVHTAQGQLTACHQAQEDGAQRWEQIYKQLGDVSFGARAQTKNAEPASADAVLAVLATLSLGATGALPAPDGAEIVVDNAGPDFWPVGNWYILDATQQNGPDCYEALPGLQSYADVRPHLAQGGLYEVSAWSCGNPHYDQTNRGAIEVHRSATDAAPQSVGMDYRSGGGQWQSLGVYNLQPGAFLRIRSSVEGSVPADAYRFTAVTGEGASGGEVIPTPLPTGPLVSNHPPSPLEQFTSGDLAARLGMTDPWYAPIQITPAQKTFDDCQAFPREGCSGTREGSEVVASYQGITLTYRVSSDYKLVAIDGLNALDPTMIGQEHPQRVYVRGSGVAANGGATSYRVVYYPDNTWHVLRYASGPLPADDMLLPAEQAATIRSLAPKYSTLYLNQPGGGSFTFYGLGTTAGPEAADLPALLALGAAFAAPPTQ